MGNRYAGGAVVPYTAGARSPTRGIAPFALPITALAIFPGLWLYSSVYAYPYGIGYHYYHDGRNTTSNVSTVDYGNGSAATYINGSLANGTTASGGTDPSNESQISAGMRVAMEMGGYWVMVATVVMGMWMAA